MWGSQNAMVLNEALLEHVLVCVSSFRENNNDIDIFNIDNKVGRFGDILTSLSFNAKKFFLKSK